MNLNARRNLYIQLGFTAFALMNVILQFAGIYERQGAPLLGGFWALAAIALCVLLILLLIDLFSNNTITLSMTVVSQYKRTYYMLREDGKVKRIRFTEPELVSGLTPGMNIKLTLLQMSRIPVSLEVVG
jgi:hypothetical protein